MLWSIISMWLIRPSSQRDSCNSRNVTEVDPVRTNITWADQAASCTEYWYWIFMDRFPQNMGIVMEIHDLYLSDNDTLMIFDTTEFHREFSVRKFKKNDYDMAPILLNNNQGVILANTSRRSRKQGYSRFTISLSPHPINAIPPIELSPRWYVDTGNRYMYNCSSVMDLTQVLRCDKVSQCIGGEDEHHCDYQHPGCGDWLPYKDRCLKFLPLYAAIQSASLSFRHQPLMADKHCKERFQASLVQIPKEEDKIFVQKVMERSGFRTVAVALKKVRAVSKRNHLLYRYLWQWGGAGGPIDYSEPVFQSKGFYEDCAFFHLLPSPPRISRVSCFSGHNPDGYVCSKPNFLYEHPISKAPKTLRLPLVSKILDSFPVKRCADNSVVQTFHPCPRLTTFTTEGSTEEKTESVLKSSTNISNTSFTGQSSLDLPLFKCRYGAGVHYSLTCDGFNDCVDGSDELACDHPKNSIFLNTVFVCRKTQFIARHLRCNGVFDCLDESDEEDCLSCVGKDLTFCVQVGCIPEVYVFIIKTCKSGDVIPKIEEVPKLVLAKVTLDGYGAFWLEPLSDQDACSETHFQCPGGYCIPTFLLNNGEQDCIDGEDESTPPEKLLCPGFYRCYSELNCVHPDFVCDGIPHCPLRDDELFCDLKCPTNCTCQGYAYKCKVMFNVYHHLQLRSLDLSGVNYPVLFDLHIMEYLHFLNISSCQLQNVILKDLHHLRIVDLSNNNFSNLTSLGLENLQRLQYLDVSNNPLVQHVDSAFYGFLNTADVRGLETLVMVNTTVKYLSEGVFDFLRDLTSLDVRGNQINSFDTDVFQGLHNLRVLRTDSSKLCCSLLQLSMSRCEAPVDELSSCDDLLGSDFFRVFLWIMSPLAIVGNVGVFLYRLLLEKSSKKGGQSFSVLVQNLCVSDCLMGVYLMLIGVADTWYRGIYFTRDWVWRQSVVCQVAGFLALVSSEVSAHILCLITVDRMLVVCFPLRKHLHFNRTSSIVACGVTWVLGVVLATIPLLPPTSHWHFYSQTAICLPLPITRQQFPGQQYTFSVFIVLNFLLFFIIGLGQMMIFRAIRQASVAAGSQREQQELAIARRLFLVAFSDFCCWFPIGLMGMLAAGGVLISGQVNVWAAVFVLPVNSALNPFLYTMKAVLDKRNRRLEQQKAKKMLQRLHGEIERWPDDKVEALVQYCLRKKLAGRDIALFTKGETTLSNKMADCDQEPPEHIVTT